jgi:hypothetical protein
MEWLAESNPAELVEGPQGTVCGHPMTHRPRLTAISRSMLDVCVV